MRLKLFLSILLLCFVSLSAQAQKLNALATTNSVLSTDLIPVTTDGGSNLFNAAVSTLASRLGSSFSTTTTPTFGAYPYAAPVTNAYPWINIAAWGDSLTDIGPTPNTYIAQLSLITGRPFYNGAISGQASLAIANRMVQDVAATNQYLTNWTAIIWAGRGDLPSSTGSTNPATTLTNIARMVAAQTNGRYFIIPPMNGGTNEFVGTTNYIYFTNVTAQLISTYSNRVIDVRAYLMSHAFTNVTDQGYVSNGIIPLSMTIGDGVHLVMPWTGIVADYVRRQMDAVDAASVYSPSVPVDFLRESESPLAIRGPLSLVNRKASNVDPFLKVVSSNGVPLLEMRAFGSNTVPNLFIGLNSGSNASPDSVVGENIGIGFEALKSMSGTAAKRNVAVGVGALLFATNSSQSTAVGHWAMRSNTADNGTAVGFESMFSQTTGSGNSAFGSTALFANATGANDTAVGEGALNAATGSFQTAVGYHALFTDTSGAGNVAVGYLALNDNKAANYNVVVGYGGLQKNIVGVDNIGIGRFAGVGSLTANQSTNDDNMIFIGSNASRDASVAGTKLINSIAIGRNAHVALTNTMEIGGTGADAINLRTYGNSTHSGFTISTNGFGSFTNNLVAPATITIGASPVSWTNTTPVNAVVYVDAVSVTGTVALNGTTIFTTIGQNTVMLQPNEVVTLTFTIGTPTAKWKPF